MATVYKASGGAWHPVREVHVPPHAGRPSFSFDGDDLLVSTGSGEVHRRPLAATAGLHPAPVGTASHEFCGTCAVRKGELLRLALKEAPGANFWQPEIMMS